VSVRAVEIWNFKCLLDQPTRNRNGRIIPHTVPDWTGKVVFRWRRQWRGRCSSSIKGSLFTYRMSNSFCELERHQLCTVWPSFGNNHKSLSRLPGPSVIIQQITVDRGW
jgi:hypothetical protein